MNRGLESAFVAGQSSGLASGQNSGQQSGFSIKSLINIVDPSTFDSAKLKPIFLINGDNVTLLSGTVQYMDNLIKKTYGEILITETGNAFQQTAGTTYRPPIARRGLNGRTYVDFGDTANRYITTTLNCNVYAQSSPSATATGFTYMFVIRRAPGNTGAVSILDARDSTSLSTTGDLLLELDADGSLTFEIYGGVAGTPKGNIGTAGRNLLKDWSILTVKHQLRIDGGAIPVDGAGAVFSKRYEMPIGATIGQPLDIFVNGILQPQKLTTAQYTNADYYGDGSYRMLDRDIFIGNKGNVFGSSGTHIAAALLIPCYISKAYQQRLENYFRRYYSLPF